MRGGNGSGAWTQPCAVLTGDTLFIGDVGRPDFRIHTPQELAGLLYDNLRNKLTDAAGRNAGVSGAWRRFDVRTQYQRGPQLDDRA